VEFPCKVAICLLDLFIVSTTGYAKDIVVIRNNLSPRHFYPFNTIPGTMGKDIKVISRTHVGSLFFYVIVCINNIIVSLLILLR
jgi:hypothetical protein